MVRVDSADGKSKIRKVDKKQRRCLAIIEKDCGIQGSDTTTLFLAILNSGLSNQLTEEKLLSTASTYGQVTNVVMLPGKSYCFIKTATLNDAEQIFKGMHNIAHIGQKNAVTYLSYVTQLPAVSENIWQKPMPPGLIVVPNFVTPSEEIALVEAVNMDENKGDLKHRRVKHFGYEFLYGINNIDINKPLEQGIPTVCDFLWQRVSEWAKDKNLALFDWEVPDQLTVNEYDPGQGIPPHVDTHSAFLDPILLLSLQSDIVMDFRRANERISVVLPRRSLLIMSGESRYDWTHGITPKHFDIVPTPTGTLTTKERFKRISLTFRKLRRSPCNCAFPTLCDTRLTMTQTNICKTLTQEAIIIEEQNVHEVYDKIANHFSETRHTPWPRVVEFLQNLEPQSIVLDIGCGNGKYLNCNQNLLAIGCDRSMPLLDVCLSRGNNVFRCDCLQLPIRDMSIDTCISIAVIHHLATVERRKTAISEMWRVLRPGGQALIYVWSKKQKNEETKSSYLLQNKAVNKHKITEQEQRQQTEQNQKQQLQWNSLKLPVHTNRTEFQQQDLLVPWKTKDEQKTTYLRYYHVFEEDELETLISSLPKVEIVYSYYDQGNYCCIFRRHC